MPSIASAIDHTLLRQDSTRLEVDALCAEAARMQCAAVCVPPLYVPVAVNALRESAVKVVTVLGFPMGYSLPEAKALECALALEQGAHEVDMVANIAALKNGDYALLEHEAALCLQACRERSALLKVIIESGILTDEEIIRGCGIYGALGVDFVKTSTGFAATGATVHAVRLMRACLPEHVQIKASGGIRTFALAQELLFAGASRLGCSATAAILQEEASRTTL